MMLSLGDLVSRLAGELHSAAVDAQRIESAIGDLLESGQPWPASHPLELQRLDRLRQNLAELAHFLQLLAPSLSGAVAVNAGPALAALLLGDLKHRLAGGEALLPASDGDCEYL